jgi:hypothetical protein
MTGELENLLRNGMSHRLLAPFVLKHGQQYENVGWSKEFRPQLPQRCYLNSFNLARMHNLIYVEGFALSQGLAFLHAWCVKPGSKRVIEVTCEFDDYFGIPFRLEYVKNFNRKMGIGCWSILDQWEDHWPILKEKPENFILPEHHERLLATIGG